MSWLRRFFRSTDNKGTSRTFELQASSGLDQAKLKMTEERLHYKFADQSLLQLALTHPSKGSPHNQRLEFLGDAVLGLVVARHLYQGNPGLSEGDLSLLKNSVVSNSNLAQVAREIELTNCIEYDSSTLKRGIQEVDSIHADVVEAIIGAVLLDGGFDQAAQVVRRLGLLPAALGSSNSEVRLSEVDENSVVSETRNSKIDPDFKHPKNRLQELVTRASQSKPKYTVIAKPEKPNLGGWVVECKVQQHPYRTVGRGKTIKLAETEAAKLMLAGIGSLGRP